MDVSFRFYFSDSMEKLLNKWSYHGHQIIKAEQRQLWLELNIDVPLKLYLESIRKQKCPVCSGYEPLIHPQRCGVLQLLGSTLSASSTSARLSVLLMDSTGRKDTETVQHMLCFALSSAMDMCSQLSNKGNSRAVVLFLALITV